MGTSPKGFSEAQCPAAAPGAPGQQGIAGNGSLAQTRGAGGSYKSPDEFSQAAFPWSCVWVLGGEGLHQLLLPLLQIHWAGLGCGLCWMPSSSRCLCLQQLLHSFHWRKSWPAPLLPQGPAGHLQGAERGQGRPEWKTPPHRKCNLRRKKSMG